MYMVYIFYVEIVKVLHSQQKGFMQVEK